MLKFTAFYFMAGNWKDYDVL